MNAVIPEGEQMKQWNALGKAFMSDLNINDNEYVNALDAISTYEDSYSRSALIAKLKKELLIDSIKIGNVHKKFCALPFDKVCTTNFDFLLEEGYRSQNKHTNVIVEESQLTLPCCEHHVELLKIHGDLNYPDQLVATESDYDNYQETHKLIATYLCSLLIKRTPLFIGYSLDDYDFRQIFQVLKSRLGKMRLPAYVITKDASPTAINRFIRRGLNAINLPSDGKTYQEALCTLFDEIKDYCNKATTVVFTASKSYLTAELLKPIRNNKICFFFASSSILEEYKDEAYRMAIDKGYIPVDYSYLAGFNFYAELSFLSSRAAYVFYDMDSDLMLSDNYVWSLDKEHTFFITKSEIELSKNHGFKTFHKKYDSDNHLVVDELVKQFEKQLKQLDETPQSLYDQVVSLRDSGHYEQSLIASVTYLEYNIRKAMDPDPHILGGINIMLRKAIDKQIIQKPSSQVFEAINIRNRLIHGDLSKVSREVLLPLIDAVLQVFPLESKAV